MCEFNFKKVIQNEATHAFIQIWFCRNTKKSCIIAIITATNQPTNNNRKKRKSCLFLVFFNFVYVLWAHTRECGVSELWMWIGFSCVFLKFVVGVILKLKREQLTQRLKVWISFKSRRKTPKLISPKITEPHRFDLQRQFFCFVFGRRDIEVFSLKQKTPHPTTTVWYCERVRDYSFLIVYDVFLSLYCGLFAGIRRTISWMKIDWENLEKLKWKEICKENLEKIVEKRENCKKYWKIEEFKKNLKFLWENWKIVENLENLCKNQGKNEFIRKLSVKTGELNTPSELCLQIESSTYKVCRQL